MRSPQTVQRMPLLQTFATAIRRRFQANATKKMRFDVNFPDFGLRIAVFDTDSDPAPDFQQQYRTKDLHRTGKRIGIRLRVAIKSKGHVNDFTCTELSAFLQLHKSFLLIDARLRRVIRRPSPSEAADNG
jgi:hypothetical protein